MIVVLGAGDACSANGQLCVRLWLFFFLFGGEGTSKESWCVSCRFYFYLSSFVKRYNVFEFDFFITHYHCTKIKIVIAPYSVSIKSLLKPCAAEWMAAGSKPSRFIWISSFFITTTPTSNGQQLHPISALKSKDKDLWNQMGLRSIKYFCANNDFSWN